MSNWITQTLALPLPWPLTGRAWYIHTACLTFITVRVVLANATSSRYPTVTDFSLKGGKTDNERLFHYKEIGTQTLAGALSSTCYSLPHTIIISRDGKKGNVPLILDSANRWRWSTSSPGWFTLGERTPDIIRIRGWVATTAGMGAFVTDSCPACREPNPWPCSP